MDDIQFNESLDALLANENLDDAANAEGEGAYNANLSGNDENNNNSDPHGNFNPSYGYFGVTGSTGFGADATSTSASATFGDNNSNMMTGGTTMDQTYGTVGMPSSYPPPLAPPPFSSITIDNRHYSHNPGTVLPIAPVASHRNHHQQQNHHHHHQNDHQSAAAGKLAMPQFQSSGASVSSSGSTRSGRRGSAGGSYRMATTKRVMDDAMAVSEDEEDRDKRRQDRNQREQERSHKITEQIDYLREVLASANIRFKPDKYSTLVTVADYIRQLQERSAMLDAEHKMLIDTISKTNEVVNSSRLPASEGSMEGCHGNGNDRAHPDGALSGAHGETTIEEDELEFVRNVDYKSIFLRCGTPLAVASIDGRFLDCNMEFEALTGYTRDELLPMVGQDEMMVADAVPSNSFASSSTSTSDEQSNGNRQWKHSASDCSQDDLGAPEESSPSEDGSSISTGTNVAKRSISLFNLLSRDHMEDVFMALSEILKHAPEEQNEFAPERKDFWNGTVRLNRNRDVEMRMNISLVRTAQGRAKFFDCSLTPIRKQPLSFDTHGSC